MERKCVRTIHALILSLCSFVLLDCSSESITFPVSHISDLQHTLKDGEVIVNVLNMHPVGVENVFYLRAHYNDQQDILLLYYQNANGIISPRLLFMGSRILNDAELMNTENGLIRQSDSTSPLSGNTPYWALYGQHGYDVPTTDNPLRLSGAHVGTLWTFITKRPCCF